MSGICRLIIATVFAANYVNAHLINSQQYLTTDENKNDPVQVDHITDDILTKKRLYFIPFATPYRISQNANCSADEDEEEADFPHFLTESQVLGGGIVLVLLIGLYGFSLLAVVCNDYFLPCVETICEKLNLTPDVAAATFMSIATSTPEFFTNIIGTFVTESDLGIGTIVGSSLFNALGVPAIGGLNAPYPLQLDWYPLTRDCLIYVVAVSVLIEISWDGAIYWWETLISLGIYIAYFVIMFNNKRISRLVKRTLNRNKFDIPPVVTPLENNKFSKFSNDFGDKNISVIFTEDASKSSIISAYGTYLEEAHKLNYEVEHSKVLETILEDEKNEAQKSLFRLPKGNWFHKLYFYYIWPLKCVLRYTVPNPKVYPNWFPLTFIMCIVWIGANSYVISWMISIIGIITKLPDALLGMTIMAVGGCLPETVSMTIIARRGEGAFGVSNSLGANTMNVLYSLGLPWLFKNIMNIISNKGSVRIQSGSLEYTILSLIVAVGILFGVLVFSKFRLSKISGTILACFYVTLVILAVLTQTVFFKINTC